jgi:hypothetical protein
MVVSRALAGLLLPFAVAACGAEEDAGEKDKVPPTVQILTPERGTQTTGASIEVTGVALDDVGIESVTVSGVKAEVDAAGRFRVDVPVDQGIAILETVVTDAGGNEATDTRAALVAELAAPGTRIPNALVAEISPMTMGVMGSLAGQLASNADLGGLISAANPIVKSGGSCLGAEVDLLSVDFSDVDVALSPADGALEALVTIHDLDVDMRARYKVACFIGGSAGINLSANTLAVRGRVKLALDGGDIDVWLEGVNASFTGFDLDVGAIPDAVVNFVVDDVPGKVADALEGPIETLVPDLLAGFLIDFTSQTVSVDVFGVGVDIQIRPTELTLDAAGGAIALEIVTTSQGVTGAVYPSSPSQVPAVGTMGSGIGGLGLAFADDAANQLLAVLWHGRALERSVTVEPGSPFAGLVDGADSMAFNLLLPPVISADRDTGSARLGIGDLFVDALAGDQLLARMAISGYIDVSIEISGSGVPSLKAEVAKMSIDVLENTGALSFGTDQLEAFATAALAPLRGRLNEALRTLTIPQFGAEVRSASLEAASGYLLISGQLAAGE